VKRKFKQKEMIQLHVSMKMKLIISILEQTKKHM